MTETVVVFVKLADVPMTVTVTVPGAAVLLAVSVSVLVLAVLLGLNDAVTPPGRPEADKLTFPLKPFCGVTVMVLAPLAPCTIVILVGEVEREKVGGGATGALTDTPSKLAVTRAEVFRLLTARPMYTFCAMLTV